MEVTKMELNEIASEFARLNKQVLTAIDRIDEFLSSAEFRRSQRRQYNIDKEDEDIASSEHT